MDTFDGLFFSLQDPAERLLFQLSFYESYRSNLDQKFREIERACYREGKTKCVSLHDMYKLRGADLERQKHKAEQELIQGCKDQGDWLRPSLTTSQEGEVGHWLMMHPECAKPHIEKYVGLVKEEVKVLTEAETELNSYIR